MPTARKPTAKTARANDRARQRGRENDRLMARVVKSLDTAQADIAKVGGSLGTGVSDLRRSLSRTVRDAQRHAAKMSKATRRDLERLQHDISNAGRPKAKRASTTAKRSRAKAAGSRPKAASASRAKAATGSRGKAAKRSRAKATTTRKRAAH
jgi:hypothetical protein